MGQLKPPEWAKSECQNHAATHGERDSGTNSLLTFRSKLSKTLTPARQLKRLNISSGLLVVMVVMEEPGVPELKEFLVIDGQQRITTVYLLLGIIRDQIQTKKHLSSDVPSYVKELTNISRTTLEETMII